MGGNPLQSDNVFILQHATLAPSYRLFRLQSTAELPLTNQADLALYGFLMTADGRYLPLPFRPDYRCERFEYTCDYQARNFDLVPRVRPLFWFASDSTRSHGRLLDLAGQILLQVLQHLHRR